MAKRPSTRAPKNAGRRERIAQLNEDIVTCERCPRLREYCEQVAVEKKKAYRDWDYWGLPVPDFVSPQPVKMLIVGLAPAAHGGNRTGRMFTGDRSGQWLYRALHRAGFATQSTYERADDGLELIDCAISATAHCAPPDNKPLPEEIANCSEYVERAFQIHQPRVILALGGIAWKAVFNELKRQGAWTKAVPKFAHAVEQELPIGAVVGTSTGAMVLGTYHPSQQNTFTGRLTEPMFDAVFSRARALVDATPDS